MKNCFVKLNAGRKGANGPCLATNLTQSASTSRMNRARDDESPHLPDELKMKTKILFAALLFILPPAVRAQTADDIVKKALEARGGAEKIKAVQAERVTGSISFGPGADGVFTVELKRPHKMHMEISIEGQKLVRVYDGKSAGWTINPFAPNRDVQPMSDEDLKSISDESDFDGPLVDYKTKGNQIELVGKEDLDGKPAYRLKLTNKNGDARFYLFDASSYFLVKWEGVRKADNKEIPWESFFSDYREVQGLKYAFKIDSGSPGTEIKQSLTAEKIEIDPQIDESHFTKPTPAEPPAAPASTPPENR
jgi:outer membrane lipoprotein-sorting protein